MFLARPGRFGKTMLVNTLEAWFQGLPDDPDTRPAWLFEGTSGFDLWKGETMRPVVRIDMSAVADNDSGVLRTLLLHQMAGIYAAWR